MRPLALALALATPLLGCGAEPNPAGGGRAAGAAAGETPDARTSDAPPGASLLGLAPARALARERGLPLLVLLDQPGHLCPPADRLRSGLCADRTLDAVCVRAAMDGGPDADAEERRLVERVRAVQPMPPALVVATPDLEILHVQVARLMPFYDVDRRQLPDDPGPLMSSQEVREMIEATLARRARVDARLSELAADPAPPARLEQAEILAARGRWEDARQALPRGMSDRLSVQDLVRLYDLLVWVEQPDRAEAVAAKVLAWRGDEAGAGWLGLRILRSAQEMPLEVWHERTARLIEAARRKGCERLEACLRAARLRRTLEAGGTPDPGDLAWAARPLRDGASDRPREGAWREADLLVGLVKHGDHAAALEVAQRLMREHPEAPESIRLRHGWLDMIRNPHPPMRRAPMRPEGARRPERPQPGR